MKTKKYRKSRTFRRVKQNRRTKSLKRAGGIFDFMKTKTPEPSNISPEPSNISPEPSNISSESTNTSPESPNTSPESPNTSLTKEQPKNYGSLTSGLTSSVFKSAKAYNMPAILGALSSKINALLIHNKVNYVFSNGYNARDYDIESEPANGINDGRGDLKENAIRGEITGVQSKVYNKGLDAYSQIKNKNSTEQIN